MELPKYLVRVGQRIEVLENVGREHRGNRVRNGGEAYAISNTKGDVLAVNSAAGVADLVLGNIKSSHMVKSLCDASGQAASSATDFDTMSRIASVLLPLREEVLPV